MTNYDSWKTNDDRDDDEVIEDRRLRKEEREDKLIEQHIDSSLEEWNELYD